MSAVLGNKHIVDLYRYAKNICKNQVVNKVLSLVIRVFNVITLVSDLDQKRS